MREKLSGPYLSVIWAALRIWLGWKWLEAGWNKVSGEFDATGFLKGAIGKATGEHPTVQGWYANFLENVALPNVGFFNFIVTWGELLVGIGLILGLLSTISLYAGALINLAFMLAGTTSTYPILYTVAIILLVVGPATYYWGLDRFALPYCKEKCKKRKQKKEA